MFNIGPSEIVIIFAIALIFIGPEQLPEVARGIAKFLRELKRTTNSFSDVIQKEVSDVKKDIENKIIPEELSVSTKQEEKKDGPEKS